MPRCCPSRWAGVATVGDSDSSESSSSSSLHPGVPRRRHPRIVDLLLRPEHDQAICQGITNPFVNPNGWPCYEVAKLVLLGPVLVPLRMVLLVLLVVLGGLVSLVATCGFPLRREAGCVWHDEPFPRWRRMLLQPLMGVNCLMLLCFGFFSVQVEDHRKKGDVKPGIIVVSPHLTDIDIVMLYYVFGSVSALGDVNILKAPFVNWIGLAGQNVFTDLKSKEAREVSKNVIVARADSSWTGPPFLIFPEGRTTNGRVLIQFRTGAFTPGKPVLPVILRYPHWYFDPTGQSRANKSFMWPFRILSQFCNFSKVEILQPYVPSAEEQGDPVLYADNVRAKMAEALGVECTNHSYDDAKLFQEACTHGIAPEAMDFEVQDMRHKLSVDVDHMTSCMKDFKAKDINGDGLIDRREFVKGYRKLSHLFDFMDTDGSDSISYTELVAGLAALSGKASDKTRAKLAFHSLDVEDSGQVQGKTDGEYWGPMAAEAFVAFSETDLGKRVVEAELKRLMGGTKEF